MIGNLIQAIKYEMKNNIPIITIWIMAMLSSLACRKNSVGSAGVIRSVSPDGGHFSSVVTIRGEGFDSINGYVTVDGVMAPITQISSTSITLTVPTTHTGPVVVKRTTGGSTTGPTFTYVDDVLVAGSLFGYSYYPVYWDNGVPFQLLTSVGGANSTATGITSSGNDIYVCGYLYYGVNPVAELWKNGTEQTLTSTTQYAEAQAIQVSGQHVFGGQCLSWVSRHYYVRGNASFNIAKRMAQAGDWGGAANIWREATNSPSGPATKAIQ
jgi:Family of unknown function (DUF6340)/IPT/TIG domain